MAYGWLEITGSMVVYFIYRHLMELGLLAVLIASIKDMRTFLQLYVPAWIAFAIYFLSIWYGAWNGHFTIIGRLVFPAAGLLLFPMLLASGQVSETYGRIIRMPTTEGLIEIVYFYLIINAMYGVFYLLPLRFVAGI